MQNTAGEHTLCALSMHFQSTVCAVILHCSCWRSALHMQSSTANMYVHDNEARTLQHTKCLTPEPATPRGHTQLWAKNKSSARSGVNRQSNATFTTSECKRKATWVLFCTFLMARHQISILIFCGIIRLHNPLHMLQKGPVHLCHASLSLSLSHLSS